MEAPATDRRWTGSGGGRDPAIKKRITVDGVASCWFSVAWRLSWRNHPHDSLQASRDRFFLRKSRFMAFACGQKLEFERLYSIPKTAFPESTNGFSMSHSPY